MLAKLMMPIPGHLFINGHVFTVPDHSTEASYCKASRRTPCKVGDLTSERASHRQRVTCKLKDMMASMPHAHELTFG